MKGSASSFSADLTIFAQKAGADVDVAVRKIAFDVFSRVIMRTPVDTGRARGNWQLGFDIMPTGTVEKTDPGSVNQAGQGSSATKQDVQNLVLTASFTQRIYLVNNLPYIGVLEYGREDGRPGSRQAPNGMVRVTVSEFQDIVEKAGGEVHRQTSPSPR